VDAGGGRPTAFLLDRGCGQLLWLNFCLPILGWQRAARPQSKQRNAWLQTVLIEAAKLAPRWNPQLATLHAHQLRLGHANRATLQVARKLVAYLLAVDKSGQPFQVHTPPPPESAKAKNKTRRNNKKAAALPAVA
jgi:hypothetical protein